MKHDTDDSDVRRDKTVEDLTKELEEHENKLSEIEIDMEATAAVTPKELAKIYAPTKEQYYSN